MPFRPLPVAVPNQPHLHPPAPPTHDPPIAHAPPFAPRPRPFPGAGVYQLAPRPGWRRSRCSGVQLACERSKFARARLVRPCDRPTDRERARARGNAPRPTTRASLQHERTKSKQVPTKHRRMPLLPTQAHAVSQSAARPTPDASKPIQPASQLYTQPRIRPWDASDAPPIRPFGNPECRLKSSVSQPASPSRQSAACVSRQLAVSHQSVEGEASSEVVCRARARRRKRTALLRARKSGWARGGQGTRGSRRGGGG